MQPRHWTLLCLFLLQIIFVCKGDDEKESAENVIAVTKYGYVRGVKYKDHYEYRGIPFAKSPVGNLRFQPPKEPEPWKEIDATEFPEFCIQYNVFWNSTEGVEDCLKINIFTPTHPQNLDKKSLLPVMVFIHSGGFMFGRGSQFRGDYLMESKKVVAVVFQYRLGSFGFLNTQDDQSFGNMGMHDQVLALKFVKENIANFGGDSSKITILGTSAGAASVHYHILSPLSKGLFHRAYSGSGTSLCPWAFQPKPKENAIKLGKFLDCPTENTKVLVDCLRTKDVHEIGFAHSRFLEWYVDPIAAFGPSLEIGNPDPQTWFIPLHPADIINKGEVNEVPWIIGFDSDEGWEHSLTLLKTEGLVKELNENWDKLSSFTLEYPFEPDEVKLQISRKVREFYLKNQPICEQNIKNLSNAYSDKTYILCTLRSAYRHAKMAKKSHPVYLYKFDYPGENSIVTLRGYPREGFGANHMDDLRKYVLNSPLFKFIDEDSKDKPFQRDFSNMIVEFASTGKIPAFSKDRPQDIWQPLDPGGNIKWYHITAQPKMEPMSADISKRMGFWDAFNLQEYAGSGTLQARDEL